MSSVINDKTFLPVTVVFIFWNSTIELNIAFEAVDRLQQKAVAVQLHGRTQKGRGGRGLGPSEKSQKYRVSLQYWSGSPETSQRYQASIYCWNIIGPPTKRHLNGVSLVGR